MDLRKAAQNVLSHAPDPETRQDQADMAMVGACAASPGVVVAMSPSHKRAVMAALQRQMKRCQKGGYMVAVEGPAANVPPNKLTGEGMFSPGASFKPSAAYSNFLTIPDNAALGDLFTLTFPQASLDAIRNQQIRYVRFYTRADPAAADNFAAVEPQLLAVRMRLNTFDVASWSERNLADLVPTFDGEPQYSTVNIYVDPTSTPEFELRALTNFGGAAPTGASVYAQVALAAPC